MKMTQLSVSSVILAAVLSGCSQQQVANGSNGSMGSGASQGSSQSQIEGHSQVSSSQQQVEAAKPVVVAKPAPVRVYNKPIVQKVKVKPKATRSVTRSAGLPPAKPGQCFAKVKVPPKFVTKSKKVLIQKASSQRVLTRAPQYRWIAKKVLVRKAAYQTTTIPAQYTNRTTKVLVKPAYNTWKKGHGAITRIDNMTGQIMCRVTVPAVYKNVTKRVQVRPAQTVRKFIPAVYKTVKQKQHLSPALYKTIHRPARYKTQNYRVQIEGARYVWRPVMCATNAPKQPKHQSSYYKPPVAYKPVKRVQTQQYRRPAANNGGISYAQYLAVMNAPLKKKSTTKKRVSKKRVIKRVVKKKVIRADSYKEIKKRIAKKKVVKRVIAKKPVVTVAKKVTKNKPTIVTSATKPKKDTSASKAAIQQNIVYGIQASLKAKGYNPGKLDGKMGANTASALKAFQGARGLPVGVLSKDTFRALGLVK